MPTSTPLLRRRHLHWCGIFLSLLFASIHKKPQQLGIIKHSNIAAAAAGGPGGEPRFLLTLPSLLRSLLFCALLCACCCCISFSSL